MQNIGDLIRNKRKEKKLTLEEVGDYVGVGKSTVRKWENGMIKNIRRDKIAAIAELLDINPLQLLGVNPEDEEIYASAGIDYIRIPLYSNLCCGDGGFVEDNILEYVPVPSKGLSASSEYFAQIAEGTSMKDAGITDGDLLIFEKTNRIDNNVIGCFCIDENKATCKKYSERNGMITLLPMNSDYDIIFIDPMNHSFRCLGKLKKIIKDVE